VAPLCFALQVPDVVYKSIIAEYLPSYIISSALL